MAANTMVLWDKNPPVGNRVNGKPCDVLYTGYLNKDISFGDIVYFEPKKIQYKKLVKWGN